MTPSKRLVVLTGRRGGKMAAMAELVRERVGSMPGDWALTIEGEGERPESLSGREDVVAAMSWAERLIRRGDYDLEEGETTTVRYHLRRGYVLVCRHVVIEG